MAGPRLLAAFAEGYPDAVFVEIGANDGDKNDHLRPFLARTRWSGVMVEPVPYVFERLTENYAAFDRVVLENVAVAETDGALPFFHLREAGADERASLPSWYDEIGSFSREAVLRHVASIPELEDRVVETSVPSVTFATLCRRHGLDRVDLVVVDTEGFDGALVRSFPFDRYRPRLFVYEHFHLDKRERNGTREHLHGVGYETLEEGLDTFCLYVEARDELTRIWHGLRPAVPGASKHDEPAA